MKKDRLQAVRIKVCGMTNMEDALCAAALGADAVGFVFAPSPRQISPEEARLIIDRLPPLVQAVGVFVDEEPEKVASIAAFCHLDLLQFHGREPAAYCRGFGKRVIKAVRVGEGDHLAACCEYGNVVAAVLLDTYVPDQQGGTGVSFDWGLAVEAKKYCRIVLAGGINADNVADAIGLARPYAVDASSGLEKRPGIKDHDKMAAFVQAVRGAFGA